MNFSKRSLIRVIPVAILVLASTAIAQWDKKPPAEWSEKEAQKVLNDSPWARTQVYSSPVTMFRQGESTIPGRGSAGQSASSQAPRDATHINFRVRFLSAKPIRQAFARQVELKQKG